MRRSGEVPAGKRFKRFEGFLVNDPVPGREKIPKEEIKCGFCQLSFSELEKTQVFGCPKCYEVFFDGYRCAIGKNPQEFVHKGTVPVRWKKKRLIESELQDIKQEYLCCLVEENYEKANQLKKILLKLGAMISR